MLARFYAKRFLAGDDSPLPDPIQGAPDRPISANAAEQYREILASLPRQKTLGARAVTRFVAVGLAFFRASLDAGIAREEAIRRVERANRRVLAPALAVASRLSRLLGRRPIARVRRIFFFMNRVFPFAPPSWQRADVGDDADCVGFDYTSCPIAAFTREQEALDLCTGAYCELDHQIGDALEVRLDRTETIALGHARCRFRWHPAEGSPPA